MSPSGHMSDLDAIRRKFYTDSSTPPAQPAASSSRAPPPHVSKPPTKPTRTSSVERVQNAPDDDFDRDKPGRSAPMDVDVDAGADARTARLAEARSENENEKNEVHRLLRAWQDERHAPDILPARAVLLEAILNQIRRQSADVNTLRRDENLSEEDHYMMMLVQTEVERMRFVVRSYVRTRLFKIEKYAAYVMNSKDVQARLTSAELQHARRYSELAVSQFRTTVLNHLPESQQALDEEIPTMPTMITEPDKDRPVFVHALEDCGQVLLPDGSGFEITKGSIHLLRYRTVEQLLLRGEVELV